MIISCAPQESTGELPEDLASLRTLQGELKKQHHEIETQLDEVNSRIEALSPQSEKKAALVTVEKVEKGTFKHYVNMQATVQSDDVVRVGSEVGGLIVNVNVDEGQNVNRGQLIARLDLESVNKQLAELETQYSLAVDVFDRQKRLWDQKIGSEMQYLQAKNNKERIEKSMELLKYQATKANVYAPISGVVEAIMLKEGEIASPGYPIVEIVDTRDLKIVADLPENYLTSVSLRDEVEVRFPAIGDTTMGKISLIGRTIDPSNRTFKVEVDLTNKSGLLKPNLLAEMRINDYTEKDVVVIPAVLMQQEVGGKNFVYVVEEKDGKSFAKKKYIETGKSGDNEIIVSAGLTEGETLIKDGARGLTEGDPINVTESIAQQND